MWYEWITEKNEVKSNQVILLVESLSVVLRPSALVSGVEVATLQRPGTLAISDTPTSTLSMVVMVSVVMVVRRTGPRLVVVVSPSSCVEAAPENVLVVVHLLDPLSPRVLS